MATARINDQAGLWISPSPLKAPIGSYVIADNVVINSPGIIESRRGYFWLPYDLSSAGSTYPKASFSYRGTLLVQHEAKLSYNSGIAFTDYSTSFSPPSPATLRMRSEEAGLNLYFTSDSGVYAVDQPSGGQPIPAGEPLGPTPTSINNKTQLKGDPDTGWLPVDSQTAYVATFFRTDANKTDHEGTPSNAIFISNPPDFTIPVGAAVIFNAGGGHFNVNVTFANSGLSNNDAVNVAFQAGDPLYLSGERIIANATLSGFTLLDSASGAGAPNTETASVTSGSKNVQVYVALPGNILAGQTVLVYRAKHSDSADAVPRPQYYLDKEYAISGTDITNGYFNYLDAIADKLLQDALYTNTDDGEPPDSSLQNDDSQPPFCLDLAEFDQRMWGANYKELQTFTLSLLGTGAPNGLQIGDTITVAGMVYTAVDQYTTTVGLGQFRVYISTDDPAGDIRQTAQELCLAITATEGIIDGFYTSGPAAIPGQMLLRSRVPGDGVFEIYVSRVSAWGPILTTTSSGALTSSDNAQTNGLWFSKQSQPEAVPLLNRLAIGPRNCSILRIRPLRDKLYVFTDIAGTYVVSNSYPYQVTSLSSTAILVAPDTLVNFDDAIYFLSSQGIVRFNESGPTILSVPIESEIKALFGTGLSNLRIKAFAVGYESYRKYMLAMPTTVSDTNNTQVWVYDVITKAWTRYTKPMDSGTVIPQTDTLYVTTPLSVQVSQERKNFDRTDYSDEDFQVNIASATGTAVTVTSTIAPQIGDLILQSPITRSLVASVTNTATNTYALTMEDTVGWALSAATLYPGIPCQLLQVPLSVGKPEEGKNFREVTYHFRTPGFTYGEGLFAGDLNPEIRTVAFSKGGWGEVPFGLFAWEQPARPVNKRVAIPTPARRVAFLSVGFSLQEAQAQWQIMGVTPIYEDMSERNSK